MKEYFMSFKILELSTFADKEISKSLIKFKIWTRAVYWVLHIEKYIIFDGSKQFTQQIDIYWYRQKIRRGKKFAAGLDFKTQSHLSNSHSYLLYS
jgi:hypothetical protein